MFDRRRRAEDPRAPESKRNMYVDLTALAMLEDLGEKEYDQILFIQFLNDNYQRKKSGALTS